MAKYVYKRYELNIGGRMVSKGYDTLQLNEGLSVKQYRNILGRYFNVDSYTYDAYAFDKLTVNYDNAYGKPVFKFYGKPYHVNHHEGRLHRIVYDKYFTQLGDVCYAEHLVVADYKKREAHLMYPELFDKRGTYIDEVTAEDGTYPNDGAQGSYWYVKDRLANQAPTISGSNLDLGSKTDDFIIDYTVSDSDGDSVTVDIFEDQVKKVADKSVALNTKYTYPITLNNFTLGRHTIKIVASDGQATAERTYTFTKSNTAPVISGEDQDLGARSTAFTENFTVTDKNKDDVAVTITLDDLEIATISSGQDKELSYTITDDQLLKFEIGSVHTVTIKADDGKGGVAYRRHTFTKVNRPPIISGQDSDLGEKEKPFSLSYSFTDVEKDPISYALYVDGIKKLEKSEVEDGKSYTYTIPHDEFIQLKYGKHTIKIEAWDDYSKSSPQVRTFTFERISGGLEVEVKINEFTVQPKKVIGVPHGIFADDATTEVYVCNNYLDSSPTWEDMSAESKAARAYAFKNETKTAEKWSIGIKVIIENGSSGVSSVLRGLKGGYE